MIDLSGKRALVTGGSRGIGAETALLLASCGADVVIGYRSSAEAARAIADRIRRAGRRAASHSADLSELDGAAGLVDRVVGELGGLDIVVANAGIWPAEELSVANLPDDRWRRTLTQNLDSVFRTVRAAVPHLGAGGRIVIVTSTAAQRGEAFHADYAASKGALVSLVKSMAIELAPREITVNSVAPGWVDTDMSVAAIDADRARIEAAIPLRRVATAADVAGPIVFLCSAQARHITGEILNVNGGAVLCG